MFPFTPHTTLRPDYVRAVPYVARASNRCWLVIAQNLSKYRHFIGKNAGFACDRIFEKVRNNIAKDPQACQQPHKLQTLVLSKKY